MKKIALLCALLVSIFGVSTLASGSAAASTAAPSGSLSCSSATTTSITITVSYANTGSGDARLYRAGAVGMYNNGELKSFPGPNGTTTYTDSEQLSASQAYNYDLRTGTYGTSSYKVLDAKTCSTTAQPAPAPKVTPSATASGSLACAAADSTSITLSVSYANAGTNGATLYRNSDSAPVASYAGASGSQQTIDRGLKSGTGYSYRLVSGGTTLATKTCSTASAIGMTSTATSPSSNSASTPSPISKSTPQSTTTADSQPQVVKFNQQQVLKIADANDARYNEAEVQATAALTGATGKTYGALVGIIVILFFLCVLVIWRFRPMFAKLDRDKSGLRRRIIIIVTLPSLLPLVGMGFLGYQQLTSSVKNSLSSQLEKAAHTSALKLDREFNIRHTIITKTASDILQIQSQYNDQRTALAAQKDRCATVVNANIPKGQYAAVTSNDDCLPFLAGFAQLASGTGNKTAGYLSALDQGATQATADSNAQEKQRVDELLGSVRHFFPDILDLAIVDNSPHPVVKAALTPPDGSPSTLEQRHGKLLSEARSNELALFEATAGRRQLLLTYPVSSADTVLGGVVVAYDTESKNFIPSIWSSTPKPYAADQVYFVTTTGELITPKTADKRLMSQLKPLSQTAPGKVYDIKLANQTLATRTSRVANTNWVVAVGAPGSSIFAPLAGIQRTALLAICGFLLLSVLLGIWFVGSIAGEIERLLKGALAFAKGNLDYRIGLKSHDELQTLGDTMNQMASDIKTAQNALVEKDKEFINIATHELKAPMTSIIGNLSMITDDGVGVVDDTARQLIDQAYSGTVRLRDIVTDMLDIARLESGHNELKLEAVNIVELTQAVIAMQAVPAQQASISLSYQPNSQTPAVLADKNKLQIILTNFVSNAIKYNQAGGSVTIAHSFDGVSLVTSVTDTGLGIPEDQKSHMFEKFYRVQHADRANVPGTGLGMHITKRFIEAMGGTVWFDSVHGQGTTFYFSLPLPQVQSELAVAPVSTPAILPAPVA